MNFAKAGTQFAQLYESGDPGHPDRLQAGYGLGTVWCWRRPGDDVELGRKYFREVIEEGPDSPWADWSRLSLARSYQLVAPKAERGGEAALQLFQECIDQAQLPNVLQEAVLHQQSLRIQSGDPHAARAAVHALLATLERYPNTAYTAHLYRTLAEAHAALAEYEQAMKAEISSLQAQQRSDPGARQRDLAANCWRIATLAEFRAGNFDVAREYYAKIIEDSPRDRRVYGARLALQRMTQVERALGAGEPLDFLQPTLGELP